MIEHTLSLLTYLVLSLLTDVLSSHQVNDLMNPSKHLTAFHVYCPT